MIENIKLIGISDDLINKMINLLGYDIVLNMACNYKLVRDNIAYLKNIGITKIDLIVLNREYILLLDNDKLINLFSNSKIENLVGMINEDFTNIDLIYQENNS